MSSLLERTVPATVLASLRRRVCDCGPTGRISLTEGELFDVLADNRRRGVIDRMAQTDGSMSRHELAIELAVEELHMPREHVPEVRIQEIHAELERTHLPMLADAGFVHWDVGRDEVSPGGSLPPLAEWFDILERLVEPIPDRERNCRADSLTSSWVPTDEA